MTASDIEVVMGWAAAEGWNPGRGDGPLMYAIDPQGFFAAFDGDEMVGAFGMPRYGDAFAFAGLYIVRPDHRGTAVGALLARVGARHAGDRVIGTDGVLEREADYARLGFRTAYHHVRWSGVVDGDGDGAVDARVVGPRDFDVEALIALDDRCFPGDRRAFMRAWVEPPHLVRAVTHDAQVTGFGVARQAVEGWRVGPLVAASDDDAEAILRAIAAELPGEVLHVDVPDVNGAAVALMQRLGLAEGFTCARMYRGGAAPDLPTDVIYGNGTLEVG